MLSLRPLRTTACVLSLLLATSAVAAEPAARPAQAKRLLLLGQKPDGHPPGTHEYAAGMALVAGLLERTHGVQTIVVSADEPWPEGPELIDGADGVALFLSGGATWLHQDAKQREALERLAARGGGCVTLHWGMGTREAEHIDAFVRLFGGCHGGPDRKYKVVDVELKAVAPEHPVLAGVATFPVHDELYYALKFPRDARRFTPLLTARIDNTDHAVAWAWERPDGGRAFGFSGLHFHDNWSLPQYRRLVAQGVLWSLGLEVPPQGLPVPIAKEALELPERTPEAGVSEGFRRRTAR